jgi:hypothetical protein
MGRFTEDLRSCYLLSNEKTRIPPTPMPHGVGQCAGTLPAK